MNEPSFTSWMAARASPSALSLQSQNILQRPRLLNTSTLNHLNDSHQLKDKEYQRCIQAKQFVTSAYISGYDQQPKLNKKHSILTLPAEIRVQIFEYVLAVPSPSTMFVVAVRKSAYSPVCPVQDENGNRRLEHYAQLTYARSPKNAINSSLLQANKQIYAEALPILYRQTCFDFPRNDDGVIPAFHAHRTRLGRNNVCKARISFDSKAFDLKFSKQWPRTSDAQRLAIFPNVDTSDFSIGADVNHISYGSNVIESQDEEFRPAFTEITRIPFRITPNGIVLFSRDSI